MSHKASLPPAPCVRLARGLIPRACKFHLGRIRRMGRLLLTPPPIRNGMCPSSDRFEITSYAVFVLASFPFMLTWLFALHHNLRRQHNTIVVHLARKWRSGLPGCRTDIVL